VGKASNEFMIEDLARLPCLNVHELEQDKINLINKEIDKMRKIQLQPIPEQIGQKYRKELDLSILKALGIKKPEKVLEELYKVISAKLKVI